MLTGPRPVMARVGPACDRIDPFAASAAVAPAAWSGGRGGPGAVGEADHVEAAVLVGEPDLAALGDDPRLGRRVPGVRSAEGAGSRMAVAAGVEVGDLRGMADIADV